MARPADSSQLHTNHLQELMAAQIEAVQSNCTHCGICVQECLFLNTYGNPGQLAGSYAPDNPAILARAFKCNLCGLCTSVCLNGVNPARMFLEMRREAFLRGLSDLPEHRGLRKYERIGNSKLYSWYALPQGCDTIFFPGCALVGSRAATTRKMFEHLQKIIPHIGIVLDCCNKPSHDLGDSEHFKRMFTDLKEYIIEHGIKNVLVACPNCSRVFREYAPELTTRSVYEVLIENPLPGTEKIGAIVTVHDPCVTRFDREVQTSVRQLLKEKGVIVEEMPHNRARTLCCGEGGGAGHLVPEQTQAWIDQRLDEASGRPIISYCAGCTNSFSTRTTTGHVLDLIFEPQTALTAGHRVTKAPLTYLNRLQFKKSLQRNFPAAVTRERALPAEGYPSSWQSFKKMAITMMILVIAFAIFR